MKYLILGLILFLVGCAAQDVPLSTEDDGQAIIAVGTLADANDPYDMASAPIITRVTVTRISTTRALRRKRISTDQAKSMLACTDATIDAVNQAYVHKSMNGMNQALRMAQKCQTDLDRYKETRK